MAQHLVDAEVVTSLLSLAAESGLGARTEAMFAGDHITPSKTGAALRARPGDGFPDEIIA